MNSSFLGLYRKSVNRLIAVLLLGIVTNVDAAAAAPSITSFKAAKATITAGDGTTLTGVFANGSGSVDKGVGPVTSGTSVAIAPPATTTYTLTVTGTSGAHATKTATVTVVLPPTIASFAAGNLSIQKGGSTTLTAMFANGSGSVNYSVGVVTSGTAVTVTPSATTTYTLTVTNPAGTKVTATATVTVAPPSITSFKAAKTTITEGSSTTLTGVFANGSGSVDNGVGPVASGTPAAVTPLATTTYTLTVTNDFGASVIKTATVTVVPPPTIASFATGKPGIQKGESTTLTAVFANGTGSVNYSVGVVTSGAAVTVTPSTTTTYTLTVTNPAGTKATATATVTVAPPSITSFKAAKTTIAEGSSTTLTGVFANGGGSVDNGVGPVASGASVTITPPATTTYTLTVANAFGVSVSKTALVTVSPAHVRPTISSFGAAPATIPSGSGTTLSWTVSGASNLSLDQGIGNVTGTTTKNVAPTTTTTYTLTATNSVGTTTAHATVTVVTPPIITTQPTSQTATMGDTVSFTAAASGIPEPALQWQMSTDGGSTWANLTDTAPYGGTATGTLTITGATTGMNGDEYRCVATNGVSPDAASNPATLTVDKATQTISFGALENKTFGDAAFDVSGTASSGLPVSFSVASGPGTISGSTVTLTGAGTVTIRASQEGDDDFEEATPVDQSFTVAKATATVNLGGLSAAYNGSAQSATASTTPAGLTVDFTYDGGATAPTNAGSYAVVGTISDANYQGSASGTLVIAKALLTAKADDQSKIEGTANPALTITYSGFVNGETAAVLDTPPTASTTATVLSLAGTYPITLTDPSDNNYALTLLDGTLTVTMTGSLWTMGDNYYGELGDGTRTPSSTPLQMLPHGVRTISAGTGDNFFVKFDGSLWAIGRNSIGQLGDGTTVDRHSPVRILSSGVESVAAGDVFTLILKTDGSLWGMGYNDHGQLGDGTLIERNSPVMIFSSGVQSVAAGYYQTLVVKTDGSLWGIGANNCGQLGDHTTIERHTPVQILSGGVRAVASGGAHSLILKTDGSLWAMGGNWEGQLGDGTLTQRNFPVQILSGGVQAIAAGGYHSLFLKTDGSLWAMGYNNFGELGDGTTTLRNTPVQIVTGGVQAIAAGNEHSLFLKTDGSLWAMGRNDEGQLGDHTLTNRLTPVLIAVNVQEMSAGAFHSLFVASGDIDSP